MSIRKLALVLCAMLIAVTPASARPAIRWHTCVVGADDELGRQLDAVGASCGEIDVPLDYADPGGRRITIAMARRPATDAARRLGTLFVNTGGPGPSMDGVLVASGALAERFDLVGVDPRFFGRSTNLDCGWPTRDYLRVVQTASIDRATFDGSVAMSRELAARCAPFRDLLPHASTRNIARDMDAVRAALGERRISYLGMSYGTHLGAVYLRLFPDRADRVVLDSALGPGVFGPSLTRENGPAAAGALHAWAAWAAGRNAAYGLGGTADEVMATIRRIAAIPAPIQVGRHRVDPAMVPGLLVLVSDSDEFYGEIAAEVRVLLDASRGVAVTPTADQEQLLGLFSDPEPRFGFSATMAVRCADGVGSGDPENYWRDIEAHRSAEPLYGPMTRGITPCAFWPVRPAEGPVVPSKGKPVLIVGAEGDPIAPHAGQVALHRALGGSLITLRGAYRHGVYGSCAAVDSYLITVVLPSVC